ncbi:MAG: DUF5675 family protein [Burkholderiaceae bacterium]
MNLLLTRRPTTDGVTLGELRVNGAFQCFTLEDAVREGEKVPGETAIPFGRYPVTITRSARFQRMLPLVGDVPGFTGIRIHAGNGPSDTEGCLLVGSGRVGARITDSRAALAVLMAMLAPAQAAGEPIWLTIIPEPVERSLDV